MTNEVAEVLRKARAKIEQPEHWGRRWFAQAANGRRVDYDDPMAVKWCAVGAVTAVVPEGETRGSAMDTLRSCLPVGREGLAVFNDRKSTTHTDVLTLFDCAIAKAEAESDA